MHDAHAAVHESRYELRGLHVGVLQITLIAAYFNYIDRIADALGVG